MTEIIGNNRGQQDVAIQDQFTRDIDVHMTRSLAAISLLVPTVLDVDVISIDSPVVPVIGDMIGLKENLGKRFYQGGIFSVVNTSGTEYNISVDTLLDFDFQMDAIATLQSPDLNVDGSGAPVVFMVSPVGLDPREKYDLTRLIGTALSVGQMGDGLFGDLPALTKGIFFRSDNGIVHNQFNAKTNGEIKEHAFDFDYADKPPAGLFGLSWRRTYAGPSKSGVTIRITAEAGDGFKCFVQDDLSLLASFKVVVEGHVVNRGG